MAPHTIRVGEHDVTYTDPGKARVDANRAAQMARQLGPEQENEHPDITQKRRELRARAKSLRDWAAAEEKRTHTRAESNEEPPSEPAAKAEPSARSRRRAAAALAATGIRKSAGTATARAKTTRTRARHAVRRYEAAGGAPVATGLGEFALFFFGGIVALVLLEDALSQKGSAAVSKASSTAASIADRIISPVPIVSKGG